MMEGDEEVHECHVCHVPIEQEHIHYGGVSCFSCRQFFRRTTHKLKMRKCKSKANKYLPFAIIFIKILFCFIDLPCDNLKGINVKFYRAIVP